MTYRIESLELYNFKSFADYHVVGPFLNFTCLIGPNGGGKSNIIDAIAFVFEMTTKHTSHGANVKENIHRKAKADKPEKECYVEIHLQAKEKSNVKIKFKKSVTLKGEVDYFFGGKECSRERYLGEIEALQISKMVNHFLLLQGEADQISSKTPLELSELFDRVSGSAEMKDDYEAVQQRRHVLEEKVNDLMKSLGYLKNERKQLNIRKTNCDEYYKIIQQLEADEQRLALLEFFELDTKIEKDSQSLSLLRNNRARLTNEKKQAGIQYQKSALELKSRKTELGKLNEDALLTRKKLEGFVDERKRLTDELRQYEALVAGNQFSKEKFQDNLKKAEEEEKVLSQEEIRLEAQMKEIEGKVSKVLASGDLVSKLKGTEEHDRFIKLNEDYLAKCQQIRMELDKQTKSQGIVAKLVENLEKVIEAKRGELSRVTAKKSEVTLGMSAKLKEDRDLVEEKQAITARIGGIQNEINKKTEQRRNVVAIREKNEKLLLELESLLVANIEHKEFKDLVIDLYKMVNGFKGIFSSLIRPIQPKFELPIKVALGAAMNYLVVDKADAAAQCNTIMKDRGLFREVLVLENLPAADLKESINLRLSLSNVGNLALDVVDYDRNIPGLDRAVHMFLKRKVITDNLDSAERLRNRKFSPDGMEIKSIITLDGVVMKKNVISAFGKAKPFLSSGFGGGMSVQEEQIEKVKADLAENQKYVRELDTNELENHLSKSLDRLNFIEQRQKTLKREIESDQGELESFEKTIRNLNEELGNLVAEKERKVQTVKSSDEGIKQLETKLKSAKGDIFSPFLKTLGISSVEELPGLEMAELEAMYKVKERHHSKLQEIKLKKNINATQTETFKHSLAKLEEANKTQRSVMEAKKGRMNELTDLLSRIEKDNVNVGGLVTKLKQEISRLEEINREAAERSDASVNKLRDAEKEMNLLRNQFVFLLNKKMQLFEEARLKSVEIPTKREPTQFDATILSQLSDEGGNTNPNAMMSERTSGGFDGSNIITIDYEDLLEKMPELKNLGADDETELKGTAMEIEGKKITVLEEKRRELKKQVENLQTKLDALSSSDVVRSSTTEVVGRLENLNTKIKKVKENITSVQVELDEANKELDELRRKRNARFNDLFEATARVIDDVYKHLTKKSGPTATVAEGFSTGGSAFLYKENQIEPFNGGVFYAPTPPSKKFTMDVDQLSGGEKTIASVALLLAINLVKGTQWMIFDETDAFLDNENALNLLNFVMNLSTREHTLQVIIISHKPFIFRHAESLVGATFLPKQLTSEAFSLDLRTEERKE